MSSDDPLDSNSISDWLNQLEVPHDAPDSLGREQFARNLADALIRMPSDRSVVTAVFGPWGSGKTWLLERIVQTLESDYSHDINVCRFSPWELNSHEQILTQFFAEVAAKIPRDEPSQNLKSLWERLGSCALIGSIGMGGVANAMQLGGMTGIDVTTAIAATLGNMASLSSLAGKSTKPAEIRTLANLKKELSEELKQKLNVPILIVIDDLDRLTDEEIQLMIRLLNTTANLPKLHYLIFGDRMQISSALDPICGKQGDRYLEKLIQNSFQVPEPGENQIRLKMWEGLETLAGNFGGRIDSKRFADFWDRFLKFRIRNLRDCYRLLRTFSFHTGALVRDGVLEVDFMDLLGIDFLRVFDPVVYQRIAAEIPTQLWCSMSLSLLEKGEDAMRIIEIFEESALGTKIAASVLLSLFPHLNKYVPKFLSGNQLQALNYGRSNSEVSPLGVCNLEKAEIYFRLDISAADLPEARVKELAGAITDELRMIDLMEEFQRRGWLVQFFARLRSDPGLIRNGLEATSILKSISSISDRLGYESGLGDNELKSAFLLSDLLIEKMCQDGLEGEIVSIIRKSSNVSLTLLLLEELRDSAECTFFQGASAPRGMPQLSPTEIDCLSDEILPSVTRSFWQSNFIKLRHDPSRAYRMAHALGPERTERILAKCIKAHETAKIWNLVEAVAISIMPSIHLNSWNDSELVGVTESALLEHLLQFASIGFWEGFILGESDYPLSELSKGLIRHLEVPIRTKLVGQSTTD